ncbi:uncharacterized protein ARMOST_19733 [Armillaria ostoyae]|uniref:MYND-type domain-containing protein n=1 Tax=Armillaria ostoyae TaxID=47428 RepID=A0A284S5B8_ARMOS|nr:uncharacterized protein ARMOST_19733 [Armillaria ostoyae]
MPHPSTRRNAQRRHWQDYSDDSFPCKDLMEAVFNKTINPSLVLHQVRRNIALISAEDIHYDPASVSEKEFGELMIPLAASSACIHGIKRLVYADPKTIKPLVLNQAMDLWPRLLPWILFFFNQVVLRRPELFNSDIEESDTDMLLTFSRTGATSGLALSSVMLRLPSILHNSQDIMSCVAHVWIVASEHRLACLSELMLPFFASNEALTKMLVQTVKQELPVPRLTSVLSRLICDIDCMDIPWDVIRDDVSMMSVLLDEDSSLGLSFRLAKSTPWLCYILSRAVEAHRQTAMEGKYPDRVGVIMKCLFCIQLALLQGPRWIVQALKHTHFLSSVLKCCLINPPAYLCHGLSQTLHVITTNLIWRTVLRQVRKSLRKIDISVIDSPGFPNKLAKSWTTLLDAANHRWETRTRLHGDCKPNFCMNKECESVDETGNMDAALHRCSGCGLTFCSRSCQKAAGDTHRASCRQERIRRRNGYPEDVVLRDEPFLRHVLLTDLRHEEGRIKKATNDFYAKLGFDDGLPPVTCMDYRSAPLRVLVGHVKEYETSIDPTEWKREVERAKSSKKKGQLVFFLFPSGPIPKGYMEWITL